jgi:TM2 domain-containing membrane protein YozV
MAERQEKNSFLAALFSLFPGGGQFYIGNYLKGFLYIMIFVMLIVSITQTSEDGEVVFLSLALAGFIIFQIFEAANDASRGNAGIESMQIQEGQEEKRPDLFAAIFVLLLGVLFQLRNLELVSFRHIYRLWPLILVIAGGKIIFTHLLKEKNKGDQNEQK